MICSCFSILLFIYLFIYLICLYRAVPTAYGGSLARVLMAATAAGLHHSHSGLRSEPHLQLTPELMAMTNPQPSEQGQGLNSQPHGSWLDSFLMFHNGNSCFFILFLGFWFNFEFTVMCELVCLNFFDIFKISQIAKSNWHSFSFQITLGFFKGTLKHCREELWTN